MIDDAAQNHHDAQQKTERALRNAVYSETDREARHSNGLEEWKQRRKT